jgi:hypothetical protein
MLFLCLSCLFWRKEEQGNKVPLLPPFCDLLHLHRFSKLEGIIRFHRYISEQTVGGSGERISQLDVCLPERMRDTILPTAGLTVRVCCVQPVE